MCRTEKRYYYPVYIVLQVQNMKTNKSETMFWFHTGIKENNITNTEAMTVGTC